MRHPCCEAVQKEMGTRLRDATHLPMLWPLARIAYNANYWERAAKRKYICRLGDRVEV